MNYPLLKLELDKPAYSNLSPEAAAAKLNEATGIIHVPVSSVDIATYLMETPCASVAPLSLYNCLSLTYRNATYSPQVQAIAENIIDLATGVDRPISLRKREVENMPGQYENAFGVLVQAGRYTQVEANGILDLGKRYKSKAQELFGEEVAPAQVNAARWLDQLAAFQPLRAAALQQLSELDAKIADLQAGNAYHELSEVQ